jgi:multidrug efflux pump subunit AcrB
LTSITTVVGLLPMATGISGGYQFWQTMAVALSSGLAFATLLTLFVIPAIYSIVDDVKSRLWRRQLLSESEIAVARSAA